MRKNGIYHKYHRNYVKTTDGNHNKARAEDLVKRQFDSFKVNEAWCGDITYIPTEEGWLYLASVVDLGSRCLVGYKFCPTIDTNLIFAVCLWDFFCLISSFLQINMIFYFGIFID